ncbi:MAG TPA: universal stress protein [Acidimicrobiia bacterium]|nr:universal stress protein [Acidimicrobiia bacterium]
MRILIATTGVLPPAPVAELCKRLGGEDGVLSVMTVIQVPRTFLDALDEEDRRSLLADDGKADPEAKALAYLEERGRRAVEPIVAALAGEGLEATVHFVEGDDPAEAIINTAEDFEADILVMGATRRLFTEEAWRSVSSRVMEQSQRPILLVPGPRLEDTFEIPRLEI